LFGLGVQPASDEAAPSGRFEISILLTIRTSPAERIIGSGGPRQRAAS
jgi:hypothetical protein